MNNMLKEKELKNYQKIKMFERYCSLSNNFRTNEPFENFDKNKVLKILKKVNDDFKYYIKEGFFGLNEKQEDFDFKFNLSLKYGIVESIIWGRDNLTNEQFGGAVSRTIKLIQMSIEKENIERIVYPKFKDYEELYNIVQELYRLYTDFKMEITNKNI